MERREWEPIEVLFNEVKPFGIKVSIIEPGAFRTDWKGASMQRAEVSEDYQSTVGSLNRFREQFEGSQSGDPEWGQDYYRYCPA